MKHGKETFMDPLTRKCHYSLEPECGKLCSQDPATHLLTRLEFIEGAVIEKLETEKMLSLRDLMAALEWEPCAISLAVGSLIRQELVKCSEYNGVVFVEYREAA